MKKIKTLIIDDERSARNEVRRMLQAYPEIEISGEASNAEEAGRLVSEIHPDLLLLDIQMPGQSGFDLLESLDEVPMVIFITAFDQYAVKAFEVSAMDYLMKPIRDERFPKAMEQVTTHFAKHATQEKRVFIKEGNQYHFINWSEVYLIESMDNYARLWYGDHKKVLIKSSLNQLEERLDATVFFRANRAQLINTHFIEMMKNRNGKIFVTLKGKDEIEVSGRQSAKLKQYITHQL
jgi:two-component system LytT family response regulator